MKKVNLQKVKINFKAGNQVCEKKKNRIPGALKGKITVEKDFDKLPFFFMKHFK